MPKFTLVSTRFNDETWFENMEWRFKNNWLGCIYGTPFPVKENIPHNEIMFVLEMNNDKNKIMGIGIIHNKLVCDKKYNIYKDRFYCKYTYKSKYRIDRVDMSEKEKNVLRILDILVFKGATHLKRGRGIIQVPDALIKRGKIDFYFHLQNMFNRHFR